MNVRPFNHVLQWLVSNGLSVITANTCQFGLSNGLQILIGENKQ